MKATESAADLANSMGFQGVVSHLEAASRMLASKPPDLRNALKESVSAVESAARQLSGTDGKLGHALAELEKTHGALHPSLRAATLKLYGYASDEDRPVLVITSNAEKELPDAFLRRCVFHYVEFPRALTVGPPGLHQPEVPADVAECRRRRSGMRP